MDGLTGLVNGQCIEGQNINEGMVRWIGRGMDKIMYGCLSESMDVYIDMDG